MEFESRKEATGFARFYSTNATSVMYNPARVYSFEEGEWVEISQSGSRVLVVDDDEAARLRFANALEKAGYHVVLAADGLEGIRKFRAEDFDLVILDTGIAEKEGLETVMEMQRNTPRAKIIAVSGAAPTGMASPPEWAERLRAGAVLIKPFSVDDLLNAIRQAGGAATG